MFSVMNLRFWHFLRNSLNKDKIKRIIKSRNKDGCNVFNFFSHSQIAYRYMKVRFLWYFINNIFTQFLLAVFLQVGKIVTRNFIIQFHCITCSGQASSASSYLLQSRFSLSHSSEKKQRGKRKHPLMFWP